MLNLHRSAPERERERERERDGLPPTPPPLLGVRFLPLHHQTELVTWHGCCHHGDKSACPLTVIRLAALSVSSARAAELMTTKENHNQSSSHCHYAPHSPHTHFQDTCLCPGSERQLLIINSAWLQPAYGGREGEIERWRCRERELEREGGREGKRERERAGDAGRARRITVNHDGIIRMLFYHRVAWPVPGYTAEWKIAHYVT